MRIDDGGRMRYRQSMGGEMDKGPSKRRPETRPVELMHRNGRVPSRRAAPVPLQRGRRSSHLSWAHAITGKFSLRANLRGRSRPTMIDLVIPRRLTMLSQHIDRSSQQVQIGIMLNLSHHSRILQFRSHHVPTSQIYADRASEVGAGTGSLQVGCLLEASPFTRSLMEFPRSRGARSGRLQMDSATGGAELSRFRLERPAPSSRRYLGVRSDYVDDKRPSDWILQLTRRQRRTDMTRTDLVRAFGGGSPVSSSRVPLQVEGAGTISVGAWKSHDLSAESTGRASSTPVMNVSLIADEVMKQLARRLVAARERMGRM